MIVSEERLNSLYVGVKQDNYHSEERTQVIFVSDADVDSVCSCFILQNLFKMEDLHYSTFIVSTEQQVRELCEMEFKYSTDLRTVWLLNLGASTAFAHELTDERPNVRVVVVDSARPLDHNYHDEQDQEVVLVLAHDDLLQLKDVPPAEAVWLRSNGLQPEDLEEDDDDSPQRAKRRRLSGNGSPPGSLERRERQAHVAALKKERHAVLTKYYMGGSWSGKPSALLLYSLVEQRQYSDARMLWSAIVSLSAAFESQRLNEAQHERWAVQLAGHVAAHGHADRGRVQAQAAAAGNVTPNDTVHISHVDDARLPLLRQWTLYDSLTHAPSISTKLHTFNEKGRRYVDKLMVQMGYPRHSCTKNYNVMPPNLRNDLMRKLEDAAPHMALNMDRLRGKHFLLRLGFDMHVTCADMALALLALLASSRDTDGAGQSEASANFWAAYAALQLQPEAVRSGVAAGKALLQAIVRDGGSCLSRRHVSTRDAHLWVVVMGGRDWAGAKAFRHAGALRELAHWLRDAYSAYQAQRRNGNGGAKPLVVVGPADAHDNCLVLAVAHKLREGEKDMQENTVATFLREAAAACNAAELPQPLEPAALEIKAADVLRWVDELRVRVANWTDGNIV